MHKMEFTVYFLGINIFYFALGTVDINTAEFEYIANRLSPEECRKLVASLHDPNYEISKSSVYAENLLPLDATCLDLLLQWNALKTGGRDKTHVIVSRRLQKLGHPDLAVWLSTTVFHDLTESAKNSGKHPTRELSTSTATPSDQRLNREEEHHEDDIFTDEWTLLDTVLLTMVVLSVGFACFRWYSVASAVCGFCRKSPSSSASPFEEQQEEAIPLTGREQGI